MSFLVGDELGRICSLKVSVKPGEKEELVVNDSLFETNVAHTKELAIQAMCFNPKQTMLVATRADGSAVAFTDQGKQIKSWNEAHFKRAKGHQFIAVDVSDAGEVYTCTSAGHLRLSDLTREDISHRTTLPTRLSSFQVSASGAKFAYGGEEVELSCWDSSAAFHSESTKKAENATLKINTSQLQPAEIWRAKRPPNDGLGLRRPVHITCLQYLSNPSEQQLITGSFDGELARYDIRSGRRPVALWPGPHNSSVRSLQRGITDHDVFVACSSSRVFNLDLRNGKTLYTYQDLSGTVTDMVVAPKFLLSACQDRLVRLHSVSPFVSETIDRTSHAWQPTLLHTHFWPTKPTAVCYTGSEDARSVPAADEERLWAEMEAISDS